MNEAPRSQTACHFSRSGAEQSGSEQSGPDAIASGGTIPAAMTAAMIEAMPDRLFQPGGTANA